MSSLLARGSNPPPPALPRPHTNAHRPRVVHPLTPLPPRSAQRDDAEAKRTMDRGLLVSDEVILDLLLEVLPGTLPSSPGSPRAFAEADRSRGPIA